MCVPGRTVAVKLLCNFSKIPKTCNIIPNKRSLLNCLSSTRSYECDSFTNSHYTPFFTLSFSLTHSKPVRKTTPCIWMRTAFDGEPQQFVTRISEQIDFAPNKTKEVLLQKFSIQNNTKDCLIWICDCFCWKGSLGRLTHFEYLTKIWCRVKIVKIFDFQFSLDFGRKYFWKA